MKLAQIHIPFKRLSTDLYSLGGTAPKKQKYINNKITNKKDHMPRNIGMDGRPFNSGVNV